VIRTFGEASALKTPGETEAVAWVSERGADARGECAKIGRGPGSIGKIGR